MAVLRRMRERHGTQVDWLERIAVLLGRIGMHLEAFMAGFGGGGHRPDPAEWLFWMRDQLERREGAEESQARAAWGDAEYERMKAENG